MFDSYTCRTLHSIPYLSMCKISGKHWAISVGLCVIRIYLWSVWSNVDWITYASHRLYRTLAEIYWVTWRFAAQIYCLHQVVLLGFSKEDQSHQENQCQGISSIPRQRYRIIGEFCLLMSRSELADQINPCNNYFQYLLSVMYYMCCTKN